MRRRSRPGLAQDVESVRADERNVTATPMVGRFDLDHLVERADHNYLTLTRPAGLVMTDSRIAYLSHFDLYSIHAFHGLELLSGLETRVFLVLRFGA